MSSNRLILTGATGFLGAHLLRDLLEHGETEVTCLARGADDDAARTALLRQLAWYFPEFSFDAYGARFAVVAGDLEKPKLGLAVPTYERLAETHATILNAAANVQHVGAASRAFRVNTEAVLALIDFAKRGLPKALHQVSTVSVQGFAAEGATLTRFTEQNLVEGQSFPGAYSESKYRAEVALRKAFEQGLGGAIYRVGFVGPHSVTGRFQRNIHQHNVARYVRGCVRLGFAPYLPDHLVKLTPVDVVARAIVTLMDRGRADSRTFYVDSPERVNLYDMVRVLHAAGYPIRLLTAGEFEEKAARLSQDDEALAAVAGNRQEAEGVLLPIDATVSEAELARLEFRYPRVTSRWLGSFLQHAIEVGFLEAPRFWNTGKNVVDLLS